MKRWLSLALPLVVLVLSAGPSLAHRGQGVTDDHRPAHNMSLVGALRLDPFNVGIHADVAAYQNLAFVGKWKGDCPGTGVDVIDISNPATPAKISTTTAHPNTSMEDMKAIRIGDRDVLAIGLQDCGRGREPGQGGLELADITDPTKPRTLSFFDTRPGGVHELDVTHTPSGRVLALLAIPFLEIDTSDDGSWRGLGDLLIVDITDPEKPALIAEWGVLDEPALGPEIYFLSRRGGSDYTYGHSARASQDGTRVYVSYWDAGVSLLDISDPSRPIFLGRTAYGPDDDGDAHSVAEAHDGTLLVQADEDISPFEYVLTSSALADRARTSLATFGPSITSLPGRALAGEIVYLGDGCPAGSIPAGGAEDPYLASPAGKIALVEAGRCPYDHQVARAQLAGAIGVLVFRDSARGEHTFAPPGRGRVTLPDRTVVEITIPAVMIPRSAALRLREQTPPPTAQVAPVFNG